MFNLQTQLASYHYKQYDETINISMQAFFQQLDTFPWLDQVEAANNPDSGCSATLSIVDTDSAYKLWVSIAGNREENYFLLGFHYPVEKKKFFGLSSKTKTVEKFDIYVMENPAIIKDYYRLFFSKKMEEITAKLQLEKKFS